MVGLAAAIPLISVMSTCLALEGRRGGLWGEKRGDQGEAATTNASVAAGGMAVEGYFLLLGSAAFLVTPIPPSQSVNLAPLLKHKTDSSNLLSTVQTHTNAHSTSFFFFQ